MEREEIKLKMTKMRMKTKKYVRGIADPDKAQMGEY